ncbi:protein split ends-like [Mizuhopecten yessoensis]|uniref:Protein split end n=1 Tax=Mizuhopecten yessoensis TaxID=6573 RepID=A0A210PDR8_MIZYE|nr:protein split ends-like [Mizuhopecten yessoensis]OWF34645.1 Protein split end [Mizuhopecten yessoensis]
MKIKLGFGKSMPTNCIWLDNLAETVSESFLCRQFSRYGNVSHGIIDKNGGKALVFFTNIDAAQFALNEMRNRILNGKKIMTDFASRDCQNRFFEKMEKSGQLQPGQRPDERRGWINSRPQGAEGGQWSDGGTVGPSGTGGATPAAVATGGRTRGNFRPFGNNRRMRGYHRGGTASFRGRGQGFNKENFTEEGFRRQRCVAKSQL